MFHGSENVRIRRTVQEYLYVYLWVNTIIYYIYNVKMLEVVPRNMTEARRFGGRL